MRMRPLKPILREYALPPTHSIYVSHQTKSNLNQAKYRMSHYLLRNHRIPIPRHYIYIMWVARMRLAVVCMREIESDFSSYCE